MIKKIIVKSYYGGFGIKHNDWNEKFEITKNNISYIKNFYQEIPLVHDNIVGGYSKAKSSWSYGLKDDSEIFVDYPFQGTYLVEKIYNEVMKLIDNQIWIYGCDMNSVDIKIELENGEKIEYQTDGSLSEVAKLYETNIVKLFKKLIPKGEKKPNFL